MVALAIALGGTAWLLRAGEARRPAIIAVFPFENLGPAGEEYFASGMTEEITTRLGEVTGLRLVPSRAVKRYTRTA